MYRIMVHRESFERSRRRRPEFKESAVMATTKQTTNKKRRSKTGPVLGAAGLSLSLAGASAATAAPALEAVTRPALVGHALTLRDEEIGDVSLATFYVFDRDNASTPKANPRLAMGACGGGGCGCGCGACGGCWTGNNYTASVIGDDVYTPYQPRPVHRHQHGSKRAKNR
jgi:hypothetical protein